VSRAVSRAGRAGAPRRLPRAARREAILRAATQAFAGAGYAATSMADVARASGITQLIVYRHFDSKEDLYRAVLQRVCDGLSAEFARGAEPGGFGLGAGLVLSAARRDPTGFRLLWRHAAREPSFASYASDLREDAIASARASLARSVPEASLEWAAHAVLGYLVEAVLNWLEFGDPAHDARFVAATNAAMRAGVRVWSKAGRPGRRRKLPR
jgi:AcrR family transcriptional regulator